MAKGMANKAPGFEKNLDYVVRFEPSPRKVRVEFNGQILAESTHMMLMKETRHVPVYYFPLDDVAMEFLTQTDHKSHCSYKGDASYWTVNVGDRSAENAVWAYRAPYDETAAVKGYASFYWRAMDHWYEEAEEIFVHARDPFKRVDVMKSDRHVEVIVGGEKIADSREARFLFETGFPTRYYIPGADVRTELLSPTEQQTSCPYKGDAIYWSAKVGDRLFEDIVWGYPEPLPECTKIKDLYCFFNENVDAVIVDGEEVPKIETPWSKK